MGMNIAELRKHAEHKVNKYRVVYISEELYKNLERNAKEMGITSIGDLAEMLIIEGILSAVSKSMAEVQDGTRQSTGEPANIEIRTGETPGRDIAGDTGTT